MTVKLIEKTYMASKESSEIGDCIKKIVTLAHESTIDGFQPTEDMTTIIMGSFKELQTAMIGASLIDDEFEKKPMSVVLSMLVPAAESIEMFLKKKVEK